MLVGLSNKQNLTFDFCGCCLRKFPKFPVMVYNLVFCCYITPAYCSYQNHDQHDLAFHKESSPSPAIPRGNHRRKMATAGRTKITDRPRKIDVPENRKTSVKKVKLIPRACSKCKCQLLISANLHRTDFLEWRIRLGQMEAIAVSTQNTYKTAHKACLPFMNKYFLCVWR